MADDVARLVAVLEADLKGFTKGMEQAERIANQRFGAIEKKMRQTESVFAGGFKNLAGGFGLGRLLSVAAIEEFSRKVLTMTAGLVDQAKVLNVTVESLQAFREAMKDSGGSAEDADQILKRLTVTIGAAKLGASQATDVFAHLGLGPQDIEGTGEQVLVRVAKALLAIKDPTVRARLEVEAFNRSGQEFERVLADVASGIDTLSAKYLAQNRIIGDDTALKAKKAVDELAAAWSKLGVATAPVITQTLTWLEQSIEGYGLLGAAIRRYSDDFLRAHGLGGLATPLPNRDFTGVPGIPARFADKGTAGGPRFQTAEEIAAAKKAAEEALRFLKELNQAANQFLSNWDKDFKTAFEDAQKFSRQSINQTRDDLAAANDQRGLAEHETQVARLAGTEALFNAQRTLALESLNVQIAAIERAKFAEKTALDERGIHWAGYEEARSNVEQKANAEIATAREGFQQKLLQIEEDQTHKLRDSISLADTLRDSFNLIGAAGVQNFHSIGDAVKQAAQQLAAAVFQLTVMKPLLDALTGQAGTPFGGILGGLFDRFTQPFPDSVNITPGKFAGGGRPPMNKLSWIGERGPELWAPDQAGVIIPNAKARTGLGGSTINIDARGAQAGVAEQITAALQRAAPQIIGASVGLVRKNLPSMMVTATQRSL